jgi:hypothetical protein
MVDHMKAVAQQPQELTVEERYIHKCVFKCILAISVIVEIYMYACLCTLPVKDIYIYIRIYVIKCVRRKGCVFMYIKIHTCTFIYVHKFMYMHMFIFVNYCTRIFYQSLTKTFLAFTPYIYLYI